VADEAQKPKNDQDDDYGPKHGYAFLLGWFKSLIPPEFRDAVKENLAIDERRSASGENRGVFSRILSDYTIIRQPDCVFRQSKQIPAHNERIPNQ
jgi:hypothetical protein